MSESKFDQSKFDSALIEYLKNSKRTVVEVINSKAYFVARKALWFTHKAAESSIKGSLGRVVFTRRTTASGRTVRRRGLELAASSADAKKSLAEMIIASRLRKKGANAVWPKSRSQWEAAIRALIAARLRSRAFLKSGWIPAIKFLAGFVKSKSGAVSMDNTARQYGSDKGSAVAATEGNQPVAKIINNANARHDKKDALGQWGARGLDLAFYDEAQSMIQYLEEKMKKDTDKANADLS